MITARQMLGVKDEAELRARAQQQARRGGLDVMESDTPLAVYVNHGRWIADCSCGAGVACDPDIGVAVCFTHTDPDDPTGSIATLIHTALVWPADRAAVESALEARDLNRNRNWTSDETVGDLVQENVTARGVLR